MWEPKQGEMVLAWNNGDKTKMFVEFISKYKDKFLVKFGWQPDSGFILTENIEPEPKPESSEITVGSVWERFDELYIVCSIGDGMIRTVCNGVTYNTKLEFFKALHQPCPDKIGMAPCVVRGVVPGDYVISGKLFSSLAGAASYYSHPYTEAIWPANNSMWVIVDK